MLLGPPTTSARSRCVFHPTPPPREQHRIAFTCFLYEDTCRLARVATAMLRCRGVLVDILARHHVKVAAKPPMQALTKQTTNAIKELHPTVHNNQAFITSGNGFNGTKHSCSRYASSAAASHYQKTLSNKIQEAVSSGAQQPTT